MTVSEFLTATNYALLGTDDETPTIGTEDASYWIATFNRKKNELYRDTTKNWSDAYDVINLGTVSAEAAPSYNLSATFLSPANDAYVIDTDGNRHDYRIIKPQEKVFKRQEVYVAGFNPQVLYFTDEIEADDTIVGGTLYLPGYYLPADVSASSDVLPVPDPYWGVMATASELAANNLTYEDRAPELNAKANNLYSLMVKNNRRGTHDNPRQGEYKMPRITSPNRY